jgi:MaoC dehydratase-like protein
MDPCGPRASAGPFGTTIAHGFLTLSLVPMLARQVYLVRGLAMAVNYGTDKVRFPGPGSRGISAPSRDRIGFAGSERSWIAGGHPGDRGT